MSEYQYHEFAAVDRPLDERQLAAVRADLREVTGKAEFARRVEALRDEHRRKPGLIGRLAAVGL